MGGRERKNSIYLEAMIGQEEKREREARDKEFEDKRASKIFLSLSPVMTSKCTLLLSETRYTADAARTLLLN